MSHMKPSDRPSTGAPTPAPSGPSRRRWEAPRLVDHGSLRHFVRAASGSVSDTTKFTGFIIGTMKPV